MSSSRTKFFRLSDEEMSNFPPEVTGIHRMYHEGYLHRVKMHLESRVDLRLVAGDEAYIYIATIASDLNYSGRFLVTKTGMDFPNMTMRTWEYDLESMGPLVGEVTSKTVYFGMMVMTELASR